VGSEGYDVWMAGAAGWEGVSKDKVICLGENDAPEVRYMYRRGIMGTG
jgi:hypothetical protein